jgi:hypothetical protein
MLVSSVNSASNISTIQPRQHTLPQMTEVAKLLGLGTSELTSELRSGATLSDLASKKGISSTELIKTIEGELTAHKPEGAPALPSSQLTQIATSIASGTPPPPPTGGFGGQDSTSGSQSSPSTLAKSLGIEPSALLKELEEGRGLSGLMQPTGYSNDGSASQQVYAGGVSFDEYV